MNSSRDFGDAVETATAEALESRRELGCGYAAEFLKNPEAFEPRKLVTLGSEGLSSFLASVGIPTIGLEQKSASPSEIPIRDGEDRGWGALRVVPLPFEASALLLGTFAGIAFIFGSALMLAF